MKKNTTLLAGSLVAVLFGLCGIGAPLLVLAQESSIKTSAFVVRPAKVELAILPGAEVTSELRLENGTAVPLLVTISFEDVAPNTQASPSDDPVRLLGSQGGEYSLRDLFSIPKERITLISGETASIPVRVRIPSDVLPGGRYGSVVLTFQPILAAGSGDAANVAVESRVATLFYVRVQGETKEAGELRAFGLFNNERFAQSPKMQQPLRFQIAFENTGTVHVNPYGRLTLHGLWGDAKEIIIDPWVVLPNATRMREINYHEPLTLGRYTAHLEQNRGYGDVIDERETVFWVLPTPEGMLVIVLSVATLIWIIRRSLRLSRHSL